MTQPYRDPQDVPSVPETCPHGFELSKNMNAGERARLPAACAPDCEQCGVGFLRSQWIRKRAEEMIAAISSNNVDLPSPQEIWESAEHLYEEGKKRGHLR